MSKFRLLTLNVHNFIDTTVYGHNISHLVSILQPLNLDLIAVQEVLDNGSWRSFCQQLAFPYFIYGECEKDTYGVGIASRYPITSYSNHLLTARYRGGRRSLLHCRLDGDHPFLNDRVFASTHLDHLDEDDRLDQMKTLNPLEKKVDILMGDLNALTREDYTDDYYQAKIVAVREQSYWEKPRFDLTNLMTNKWNYIDAFKSLNPTFKNQQVVTCEYNTRIDYIYLHPRINDQWTLTQCRIINTNKLTDHNGVFAEFKQK